MKKPVLIGLAPADPSDVTSQGETAFSGRTGAFLAKIARLPDLSGFERKNLLPLPEEHYGRAERYAVALRRARELRAKYDGHVLVLCGGFVAQAFGLRGPVHVLTEATATSSINDSLRVNIKVIPHPSGRCRLWNNYETRERVGTMLRSLVC